MADLDDIALLREFAERQFEPAFAEIVRRHLSLVYSVALRFTHDCGEAEDIAQAVFILLARKAGRLREHTSLTGWLYETTRFTAMKCLRSRARRAAREREAIARSVLDSSNSGSLWQWLEPMLEEGMSRMSEDDRTLIALHFFENKSHSETAAALGISEWATRKRVARAVDKLRHFFAKRGVALPAAVLAAVISSQSTQAAPATLARTITMAAVAKGATASTSTLTLIKGALKIMAWTKMKTIAVVGLVAALATGTTILVVKHEHPRRASNLAPAAGARTDKSPAQELQGRWKGTNTAHPGQRCTVTISGDRIEYRGADPNDWLRGTFVVNESAKPRELDVTILEPANGFILCIYEANGNGFTLAAAEHGSSQRPIGFVPGRQVDILELQRD